MDTNKQREHYTIESGKSLVKVSNLLILYIGVSVVYVSIFLISVQTEGYDYLLFLNFFYVVFCVVVLGMSIYSLRISGVNLIKSINPTYHSYHNYSDVVVPVPTIITSNGFNEEYWSNGVLYKRYTKVNGKYEGIIEKYYENGQLEIRNTCKNGVLDGISERFYRNGQLCEVSFYVNGVKDGTFNVYHENGQPSQKGGYSKGQLSGYCLSYNTDGELISEKKY